MSYSGLGGDAKFFQQTNTVKLDEVIKQLDSNVFKEKLVGMKKVIAMASSGKEVEPLFPYVVKNVVTKNVELKKLVYMYLIHYAEQKQEEALLSINNFQKDLDDKNQFLRALALRVMSSLNVSDITNIIVVGIKKCIHDMSPYVRKAAALAIPKAYRQSPDELRDELSELIGELLKDNNTMVLGAAIHAFNEVCPNRFDLIHPVFRKLCRYVVDCDEWGQVVIIQLLTRYGRAHFQSPFNAEYKKRSFYDEEEDDEVFDEGYEPGAEMDLDQDHRLLLKCTAPLLRTKNTAVVLMVVTLHFYLAPKQEFPNRCVSPLLRVLRSYRENAYVVLMSVATMAKDRPEAFSNHLKDFFIYSTDPTYLKTIKLEILSLLATDETVHGILKEFRTYVKFPNEEEFVIETIKAISRVASKIPEVIESCIGTLMNLITKGSEQVVAESVIAIRQLLQQNPEDNKKIILQMAILLEDITVPISRSSIAWMIGEYLDYLPKESNPIGVAADALRILVKNFIKEDDLVKLQALNLGSKLYLKTNMIDNINPDLQNQVNLLFQYVLNLARFDQSYDVRDRARFIRNILFNPKNTCSEITERAAQIFTGLDGKKKKNKKKATTNLTIKSKFIDDRDRFTVGTLSHVVNHSALGYEPLPDFPAETLAFEERNVFGQTETTAEVDQIGDTQSSLFGDENEFFNDIDEEEEEEENELKGDFEITDSEEEEEEEDEEKNFYSEEEEEDEEDEEEEDEEEEDEDEEEDDEEEDEDDEEEDDEDEEEDEEDELEEQMKPSRTPSSPVVKKPSTPTVSSKKNLLDFN
ncbi:hypothetical protein ABK040_004524 [Willaertia magna]